jgi:AcrR family transcriptional regulator
MAQRLNGSPRTSTSRLSVDDWLEVGYAILAEDGFKQIKVDSVCARMGATKGSFYWHFEDMAAYKAALVAKWGEWRDEQHQVFDQIAGQPPRERLAAMISQLVSPRHWTLERAMREWARWDTAAAASVRASDRRARRAVRQAFLDYGFDAATATMRAEWIFAVGIGALHLSSSKGANKTAASYRYQLVDLMLSPVVAAEGENPA